MSVVFVVPCFNEAERWNDNYWATMVKETDATYLFVDDGSSDDTWEIVSAFTSRNRALSIYLPRNMGKAEAVRQGWQEILRTHDSRRISALGFMDADGAFAVKDVARLLDLVNTPPTDPSPEAWWSSRVALAGRNIQRNMWRHYVGRVVATYLSWGEPSIPYDTQSGLKLFECSTDFISVIRNPFVTRWLFEMEILIRFRQLVGRPMRVWEMPLLSWFDVAGSKVTRRESTRVARELLLLKRTQRRGSYSTKQSS